MTHSVKSKWKYLTTIKCTAIFLLYNILSLSLLLLENTAKCFKFQSSKFKGTSTQMLTQNIKGFSDMR
jgi:hypothetical protein